MPRQITYVAGIENGSIFLANFGKRISFVAQQPVHIPDESQVVLVPAGLANGPPPLLYSLQYLVLNFARTNWGPFREATHQLVEEFLGADLEVERVPAVFHAYVEQVQSEHSDVGITVIDKVDYSDRGLSRSRPFFVVDEVGNLESNGQVGLVVLGTAGLLNVALQLGSAATCFSPAVPRSCSGSSGLHTCSRRCNVLQYRDSMPSFSIEGVVFVATEPCILDA